MKIHIPFTKYDIHISKRGFSYLKNGNLVSFADWTDGWLSTPNTPFVEQIYSTIASEFAKIDFRHVRLKNGLYETVNDNLDYIVSERPNPLQSKFDFLYTMIYQLFKYGNAFAFLKRDKNDRVIAIEPINVTDYVMGDGYSFENGTVLLKFKATATGEINLVDYRNIIHLRLNPNNVFYGDSFIGADDTKVIIDVLDQSLNSLINELSENGTVRGVVKIGNAGIGYSNGFANRAMLGQDEKIDKQQEVIDRIKKTKGGILVLDAGEEWVSLSSPFETVSTETIDKYIEMLLQFYGISKKVVNGEATYEEMEVFFNKKIAPRVEQLVSEYNYKIFTQTSKSQGHRIEYYRNVFEYLPVEKAIDVAYKGAFDTTTNERRRMIYKLPPIAGGDVLMYNKNFEPIGETGGEENEGKKNEQNN